MLKNFKQSWEFETQGWNYTVEMVKSVFWFITLIPHHDEDILEIATKFTLKKDAFKKAKQLEKEIELKDKKEIDFLNKNGNLDDFIFKGEFISVD